MIKGLPRLFLWTEIKTMKEFVDEDIHCWALYNLFAQLKDYKLKVDVNVDVVKLFNEVYYQLTRIYYEKPSPEEYSRYIYDIKANLGWSFSADLVMTIIYTYFVLQNRQLDPKISRFLECIEYANCKSPFWKPFTTITSTVMSWPKTVQYPESPCPSPPQELRKFYIPWREITLGYDEDRVKEILALWNDKDDKKLIAKMIDNNLKTIANTHEKLQKYKDTVVLLNDVIKENEKTCMDFLPVVSEPSPEEMKMNDEIEQLREENGVLQKKIDEMNAEIESLNALLSAENNLGKNRKFTLVEIVEHCKNRVEWGDVKDIVAMLNKLLRKNGTEEEHEMVDGIEEEFKKRTYGDTHIAQQTIIPSVGTYNAEVKEQNNNYPAMPFGQQGQKQLEK